MTLRETAIQYVKQGWLEGELTLTESTVGEFIERVGAHIYVDFQNGVVSWEVANASLESLNVCEDLWLEMPEIPEAL